MQKIQFETCRLSFCHKQLKSETEKYSTNYFLMPEHFNILFTFNSSAQFRNDSNLIACSNFSSFALRPITKKFLLDKVGFMTL